MSDELTACGKCEHEVDQGYEVWSPGAGGSGVIRSFHADYRCFAHKAAKPINFDSHVGKFVTGPMCKNVNISGHCPCFEPKQITEGQGTGAP